MTDAVLTLPVSASRIVRLMLVRGAEGAAAIAEKGIILTGAKKEAGEAGTNCTIPLDRIRKNW